MLFLVQNTVRTQLRLLSLAIAIDVLSSGAIHRDGAIMRNMSAVVLFPFVALYVSVNKDLCFDI